MHLLSPNQHLFKAIFAVILSFVFILSAQTNTFAQSASFKYDPSQVMVTAGNTFEVNIMIDTAGNEVGGAGAKIKYDAAYLAIMKLEPGSVFADYPTASFDNITGNATLSAIVSSPDDLYTGSGLFGKITFLAKTSGMASATFDFTPGSTIDSNIAVIFGNGDILAEVNELSVNIEGAGTGTTVISITPPVNSLAQTTAPGQQKEKKLIDKIRSILDGSWFRDSKKPTEIDAYSPLTAQEPNRNPFYWRQDAVSTKSSLTNNPLFIPVVILTVVVFILILLVIRMRKKHGGDNNNSDTQNNATIVNNDI